MVATQFTWSERRALRWMRRRGAGLQPSEEAFALLVARMSTRWWAGLATYGPLLVFVGAWIARSPIERGMPTLETVLLSLVPVVAFGVAQVLFTDVTRRSDRRLAADLPHRVSRTQAVSVWTVLGPIATAVVAATVVAHVVIAVQLFRLAHIADAAAYVVGVGVIAVIVVVTLRRVLRRPTVAGDPTALAVDERLRATDALLALSPLFWVGVGLLSGLDLPRGVASGEVLWLSTGLVLLSGLVGFSHPDARARYGRGGIWGPA